MRIGKLSVRRLWGYTVHFAALFVMLFCIGYIIQGGYYFFDVLTGKSYKQTVAFTEQYKEDIQTVLDYLTLSESILDGETVNSEAVILTLKKVNADGFYAVTVGDIISIYEGNISVEKLLQQQGLIKDGNILLYSFFTPSSIYVPFYNNRFSEYELIDTLVRDNIFNTVSNYIFFEEQEYISDINAKETTISSEQYEYIIHEYNTVSNSTISQEEIDSAITVALLEEAPTYPHHSYAVDEGIAQYVDSDIISVLVEQYIDVIESYTESIIQWKNGLEKSNFVFYIENNGKQYSSKESISGYSKEAFKSQFTNYLIYEKGRLVNSESSMIGDMVGSSVSGSIYIGLESGLPYDDRYSIGEDSYTKYQTSFQGLGPVFIGAGIVFLLSFGYLIIIAGRENGTDEVVLKPFDRKNSELAFIVTCFLVGIFTMIMIYGCYIIVELTSDVVISIDETGQSYRLIDSRIGGQNRIRMLMPYFAVPIYIILFRYFMRFVRRKKAGISYWSTSVFGKFSNILGETYRNRATTTKTVLLFILYVSINFILMIMIYHTPIFLLLLLGVQVVTLAIILKKAIWRNKLKIGLEQIAKGNIDYQIDTKDMIGEEKVLADRINILQGGLKEAVDKSVKDERLRSELITNVSHDIKTPLTSIINYVDLIKREKIENEVVNKYINVLDSKSQRLKHLIEDLVEVSKVNSGNITLDITTLNLMELLKQTLGEFEDKFAQKNLHLVSQILDTPTMIDADGRRVWRILENLLNNTYKYAMPNTRVYVDTFARGNWVGIVIKNISENPLNMSANELTERFVRGDVARTTEGSGLGLSIAKSLAELMGGQVIIYLDGDLFRVTVVFPLKEIKENKENKEEEQVTEEKEEGDIL